MRKYDKYNLALITLAAGAALLCSQGLALAQCSGDCSNDLLNQPKRVEKYVKKRWKAISKCAKKGVPACPDACPLPLGTAPVFGLSQSCTDLVDCNLDALAGDSLGATWDVTGTCPVSPATDCGKSRAKAAGKLLSNKLKRRRTSKMNKFARDVGVCVVKANKAGTCDGETLCPGVGSWVDGVFPVVLKKKGYQTVSFIAPQTGEGKATLSLSAESADWGSFDSESVVVAYDIDGVPMGTIVLYGGQAATSYRVLLGDLAAGTHTIGLRHKRRLSPASKSAVLIEAAAAATVLAPTDPGYDALRFAPLLRGIDTKLNVIGNHPGNAVSDVPLIAYVRAIPGSGTTTYEYVLIWSNEDGGTGHYPDVLLADYGRTTDIETILQVVVTDTGSVSAIRYRFDESGSLLDFAGDFVGTHPVLRTRSANGLIADDGESTLLFALAPFEFDDSGGTRARGMDLDPVSYAVMGKEMIREIKTEAVGDPSTRKLSDIRNYVILEYDIDVNVSGDVLRGVAIVNGVAYYSDHNKPPPIVVLSTRVSGGKGRTAVELPPGTTLADIDQVGMQGLGLMSGTLFGLEAFVLGPDFQPGTRFTFTGALASSGLNPTWLLVP